MGDPGDGDEEIVKSVMPDPGDPGDDPGDFC